MPSPAKPRLLYISPVMPARGGSGLAMRAGMVLEALSAHFDVWLFVVQVYPGLADRPDPDLTALVRDTGLLDPRGVLDAARRWRRFRPAPPIPPAFAGVEFDVIHVFRSAAAQFAAPFAAASPGARRQLDLDELDSHVHQTIASLRQAEGREAEAAHDRMRRRVSELQERALESWDRVFVASRTELERLPPAVQARAAVLPNAVRTPVVASRPAVREPTLLFVGTLAYYPNEDAVRYFCANVLPLIRSRRSIEVLIVGKGADAMVSELGAPPGVHRLGAVPDLADCYAAADAVIVPIRAGGGTRIKILEAFSYGCPVVSTRIGAEGIDARHGQELLFADGPSEFADACLELLENPAYAAQIGSRGRSLWLRHHTPQAMIEVLAPAATEAH
jgi:polysaccharide biosynthesis protein PslH